MSIGQWIFMVILALSPVEAGLVYLLCQFLIQKMPKQKQETAERILRMTDHFITRSVQSIEQTNKELRGTTRKDLATRMIVKRLNEHNIPVNAEMIDSGIEALVSLLPKTHKRQE